jgi:drug/metabolite transporter (DMT)-like permease
MSVLSTPTSKKFNADKASIRAPDVLAFFLITFLSSFTPIAVHATAVCIPPILGGIMRFGIATVILGAFLIPTGRLPIAKRADWPRFIFLGLMCVPINQTAFFSGVLLASASHAAMIYSATPVVVTIMACLLGIERWSTPVFTGASLAMLGVFGILMSSGLRVSGSFIQGDLLLLLATFSWSIYLVFSPSLNERYGALQAQFWTFFAGTLISIPVFVFQAQRIQWSSIRPASWLGLAYLSVVVAVIVFFLYQWSMRRQPPSRVATVSNLAYPMTLIWEALLTHQLPGFWFLAGSALIFSGMVLTIYRPKRVIELPEELDPIAPLNKA